MVYKIGIGPTAACCRSAPRQRGHLHDAFAVEVQHSCSHIMTDAERHRGVREGGARQARQAAAVQRLPQRALWTQQAPETPTGQHKSSPVER